MKLDLTPANLLKLAKVSLEIQDLHFFGTSRNTVFGFRAGFIYVCGKVMRPVNFHLCTRRSGNNAEILVLPQVMGIITTFKQLNGAINMFNTGIELEIEDIPDVEKALGIQTALV